MPVDEWLNFVILYRWERLQLGVAGLAVPTPFSKEHDFAIMTDLRPRHDRRRLWQVPRKGVTEVSVPADGKAEISTKLKFGGSQRSF